MSAEPTNDLEALYRRDGERLWRSLVGYTGDRDVATEAVAEAFAQALGRGDAVRDRQRWIWRAAFRIAAGEMKRRSVEGAVSRETSYALVEPPIDLLRALEALPPKQRAALILRHYAGYPTREVAEILGSSQSTVRVQIHQARRRLRRLLQETDE